jgi:hypothetical protein
MYDYSGYKYGSQPTTIASGQPVTPEQKAAAAYPTQNIPGVAGGMNDMLRMALQGNPNLLSNMKNQFMGSTGTPLNINPPNPVMSAIFSQPPATSSGTAIQ